MGGAVCRGKRVFSVSGPGFSNVGEAGLCGSRGAADASGGIPAGGELCTLFSGGAFFSRDEFCRERKEGKGKQFQWNDRAALMRKGLPHGVVRQPLKKNGVNGMGLCPAAARHQCGQPQ